MPQTLGEFCQSIGEVRYATIYMDPETERSNGTGKVDFDSLDTALRAVSELTGAWLDGSQITVEPLGDIAPEHWQRRQNDGRLVFIGGLDFAADDEALRDFASAAGEVVFAKVFLDRETGRSRGCGKVEFESIEAAERAIRELDGRELQGRRVTAELLGQDSGRRALPRRVAAGDSDGRVVFFGGLDLDTDDGALWSLAEEVGGVTFARVFVDRETGRSRGCGKVEFESADLALRAIAELNGREVGGRWITVEPLGQNSGRRPLPRQGPPQVDGRQIYVSGLGADTGVDALRSLCERVGAVSFATLFTDRKTGRPKGSAKVEFETIELAQRAVERLDGEELLGSRISLRIMSDEAAAPRQHRELRGPPAVDGRQLFVSGLSPETDSEALRRFCEWAGKTTFATVFTDRESGQPKGSGKVEFETAELAQCAVAKLDGTWLDGHSISVRVMSQAAPGTRAPSSAKGPPVADGRQVFLSGLGVDADADALRWFCQPVGEVTFAMVFTDRATGQPRGTGKVEFQTQELAQRAANELDGKPLKGRTVAVRVMDKNERPPRQHEHAPYDQADPECKLFVGSLPPDTSEDQLQDLFRQAGEVRLGRIFGSAGGGRGLAGQVVMASAEEAQRAISVLNDTFLMGKRIVVRLDAPPRERASQQSYDSMVFVGGLGPDATAEMLQEHFAAIGDVLHASVFTDRDTGRSRGSGKVEFLSPLLAQRAVEELNNSELGGRPIKVKPMEARPPADGAPRSAPKGNDGRQLLLSGLGPATSSDSLRAFCEERIGSVTYAAVFADRDSGESKGTGKVEFQTLELANRALQELQGEALEGGTISIRRAGQAPPDDGRTIFVRGLSWDVSSEDLKVFASQIGEVSFAAVFIDKESGRSKGSGKVQFASPELAEQAVLELTGAQLYGREVSVRLMKASPAPGAT